MGVKLKGDSSAISGVREFAGQLSAGLGKVPAKFVEDAVTGIYTARSVHLTDIALALDEEIAVHATHKRISRNLARVDLGEVIAQRLLAFGARRVHENTPLFVHVYDLQKKYATKMQYLLGDVESPHPETGGYRVCEVVAGKPGSVEFTPLVTHLWSQHAPGFVSDCEEILTTVRGVHRATGGRGIFFNDDSVTVRGVAFDELVGSDLRFVLSDMASTRLSYQGQIVDAAALAEAFDAPYALTLYKMVSGVEQPIICQYGSLRVRHPDFHDRALLLIVLNWDSPSQRDSTKTPFFYVCSDASLTSRKLLTNVICAATTQFSVVHTNLTHKASFNLHGFRVLTYDRLRVLMTMLQAATYFEAAVARKREVEELTSTLQPRPGNHPRGFLMPESMANGSSL